MELHGKHEHNAAGTIHDRPDGHVVQLVAPHLRDGNGDAEEMARWAVRVGEDDVGRHAHAAVVAAAESELVTAVPRLLARVLQETLAVVALDLPLELPELTISQTWHPRGDADPAHRWLRACVVALLKEASARRPATKAGKS